ncbi:MAG: hypothetical protein Kow0031_29380 [Anaerolineae bacterium]
MFKRILEQLAREIEELEARGDKEAEMQARGKKAAYHLLSFNLKKAMEEGLKITTLNDENAGQYAELAYSFYTQGKQLAAQGNQPAQAKETFHKAAGMYHVLGDRLGEALSMRNWAVIELNEGDYKSALKHLNHAIDLFADDSEEIEIRTDLYQNRAHAKAMLGEVNSAWTDLDKALQLAHRTQDAVIIREAQQARQKLAELLENGDLNAESG